MSSNLINLTGVFAGCDFHNYFFWDGLPWPPGWNPAQPHIVAAPHNYPPHGGTIVTNVTTTASPVVQKDWAMRIVPHIPVPVPIPHPVDLALLAVIIWFSSSKPALSASSVTGQKVPLEVEIFESVGFNIDCSDDWMWLDFDVNPNTVKTTPGPGDYAQAAFWVAAASFFNKNRSSTPSFAKGGANETLEGAEAFKDAAKWFLLKIRNNLSSQAGYKVMPVKGNNRPVPKDFNFLDNPLKGVSNWVPHF